MTKSGMTGNAKLKLFCSKCGAKAQATCDCGVSYVDRPADDQKTADPENAS
jgi:hypothetical protein